MPDLLQCQINGKVIGQWIFESPLWSLINQCNSNLFPLLWMSSLPTSTSSTEHSSGCRLHNLAHFQVPSFWIISSLAIAGTENILLLPYNTPLGFFIESFYFFNFSLEAKWTNNYPPSLQGQHKHLPPNKAKPLLLLLSASPSLTSFLQSLAFAAHQFPSALLFFHWLYILSLFVHFLM